MIERELPPAEWWRLAGTDLGAITPHLSPVARIAIVESGDGVIGCWGLVPMWHAEGVWIAPDHRGRAAVARRLWRHTRAMSLGLGLPTVITGAGTPSVQALLERHGATPLPPCYRITW